MKRFRIPPIEALREYPNWMSCLDEEAQYENADVVLKPAPNQSTVDANIALTAAVASGSGVEGMVAAIGAYLTLEYDPDYVVLYRPSGVVVLSEDALGEGSVPLPLTLRSLLPSASIGKPIEIEINEAGEFIMVPTEAELAGWQNAMMTADLKSADELFRVKDYYGAVRLLRKHAEKLTAIHQRKLEFALSKCDRHFLD